MVKRSFVVCTCMHTQMHPHARTHACTQAHTHTHTHTVSMPIPGMVRAHNSYVWAVGLPILCLYRPGTGMFTGHTHTHTYTHRRRWREAHLTIWKTDRPRLFLGQLWGRILNILVKCCHTNRFNRQFCCCCCFMNNAVRWCMTISGTMQFYEIG